MSVKQNGIDWESLRKRFSRKKALPHGDTLGTVHLAVALIHAGANGVPSGMGTNRGKVILDLPDEIVEQAKKLWAGSLVLTSATHSTLHHQETAPKEVAAESVPPPPTAPGNLLPAVAIIEQTSSAPPPVSTRSSPPLDWVRCPSSTADYRLVIVGELPQRDLHPVAFVNPGHQPGTWYAQEKPLVFKQGRAFCAYLNIGNPLGIGFRKRTAKTPNDGEVAAVRPLKYFIKVYALEQPWEFRDDSMYRKAFPEGELLKILAEHEVRAWWPAADSPKPSTAPWLIERNPPAIDDVKFQDAETPLKRLEIPAEVTLVAPATLSWTAAERSHVEVRKAFDHDRLVTRIKVGHVAGKCSVLLTTKSTKVRETSSRPVLKLQAGEFYRIKLYPERPRRFLEPLHEVWIRIQDAASAKSRAPR